MEEDKVNDNTPMVGKQTGGNRNSLYLYSIACIFKHMTVRNACQAAFIFVLIVRAVGQPATYRCPKGRIRRHIEVPRVGEVVAPDLLSHVVRIVIGRAKTLI